MSSKNDPLLFDHEVDGIRELDNVLPRWWLLLFYFSIIFAVIYLFYYEVSKAGKGSIAAYEAEMAAAEVQMAKHAVNDYTAYPAGTAGTGGEGGDAAAPPPAAGNDEPSSDAAILAEGKQIYMMNCFACHAADGGGLVGPNMTDNYWIHGHTFADNLRVINEGVLEKGMIAWKTVLKQDQIYAVASYLYTLRGTTPAAPKAPEGTPAPEGA